MQRLPSVEERKLEKELAEWVRLAVVAEAQLMNTATERNQTGHQLG